jgi:hypothetical protein
MQFFTVTDQSSLKHKVLVIPLSQQEMNQVAGQCEKCMPSLRVSSMIQMGHPYLIVDFGADAWKTAIPLDERSEDGDIVGDELAIGDVLNVILTAAPNAMRVSGEKVYLNVPLEALLAFSILITADIAETYALHKLVTQPKAE